MAIEPSYPLSLRERGEGVEQVRDFFEHAVAHVAPRAVTDDDDAGVALILRAPRT
jgi:hypothetical protein